MAGEITINCRLNVGVVPASSETRLLYLLVEARPGENARPLQAAVNLVIALDVSESMRLPVLSQEQFQELARLGQVNQTISDGVPVWTFRSIPDEIRKKAPSNLEAVQASITAAAGHLENGDRVSLVAFANRAETLLSGIPGSEHRRVMEAVSSLSSLKLGDETEIGAGLEAGISEARHGQTPGMVNRVLVLTDGFTHDPQSVLKQAKLAGDAGIAVSTLGIGTEFNEKLLVDVADASHGNAYFARVPSEIPPAFGQELAVVQAIMLHDVQIEFKFSTGVALRRAYRVRPAISTVREVRKSGRAVAISMGDLDPANPPALLVELIAPVHNGGTFRLARVTASGGDAEGKRATSGTQDVLVDYSVSGRKVEPDPVVMNTVERVTAYTLQTRALDDMAMGNLAGATQKLRAAATRLLTAGEAEMAQAVEAEAARLEHGEQVSAQGSKELRYATRRLTTKLEA